MQSIPEIIQWLGGILAFFSLLVAASSLLQNLERERRALAVRLIYDWAGDTDWPTSRAIIIVSDLSQDVIRAIDRKEEVSIPSRHFDSIISILETNFPKEGLPCRPNEAAPTFKVTPEHSAFIKFLWVRWLNRLEGTLAAWLQGAADPELMEHEFQPLVTGRTAELEAL
jgi:hypothetical protein